VTPRRTSRHPGWPADAGRRFERDLEAALYFVALEALANVQNMRPARRRRCPYEVPKAAAV